MSKLWCRALACVALCALAACGDDEGSKSAPGAGGEGSGGDGGGNAPSSGAGRPGTGEPGDFDSIWVRASGELLTVDQANPVPREVTFEYPGKVTDAQYGVDAEVFEQIDGGELVIYAHYDESEVYFRMRLPLMDLDGAYYRATATSTSNYELEDGSLKLTQTQSSGNVAIIGTTYFEKYSGDFPPPDWPTTVVDVASTEVVP